MRLRVGSAVAVAIVAWIASGAARAEPPFFRDGIVLQSETEPPTLFPDCLELPVSIAEGTSPAWGFASGSAFACPVRTINEPYEQGMSMVVLLNLRGGTIVATPGASLTDTGPGPPPSYSFPAGDYCIRGYSLGVPSGDFVGLGCVGPITEATGIFKGRTGFVRYSYSGKFVAPGVSLVWTQLPRFEISFS